MFSSSKLNCIGIVFYGFLSGLIIKNILFEIDSDKCLLYFCRFVEIFIFHIEFFFPLQNNYSKWDFRKSIQFYKNWYLKISKKVFINMGPGMVKDFRFSPRHFVPSMVNTIHSCDPIILNAFIRSSGSMGTSVIINKN